MAKKCPTMPRVPVPLPKGPKNKFPYADLKAINRKPNLKMFSK